MKITGKAYNRKSGKTVKFKLTSIIKKRNSPNDYYLSINGHTLKYENDYLIAPITDYNDILDYLKDHDLELKEINHFKIDRRNKAVIMDTLAWYIDTNIYSDETDNILLKWYKNDIELLYDGLINYIDEILACSSECNSYLHDVIRDIIELLNGYDGLFQWNYFIDGFMESERDYIKTAYNDGELNSDGEWINLTAV